MNSGPPRVSIDRIKATVAAEFGVPIRIMTDPRRFPSFVVPRQVAMALACRFTQSSEAAIGRMFGHRDRTTVRHGSKRIRCLRALDEALDVRVRRIEELLFPPEPRAEVQLSMFIGPLFDGPHRRSEAQPC